MREGWDLIRTIEGSKSRGGDITPNFFFLAHTPAGAESDLNAAAAAPSQTEVTDLNCSDHSTTSKEMVSWRALLRIHLTRIQDPTLRYTAKSGDFRLARRRSPQRSSPTLHQQRVYERENIWCYISPRDLLPSIIIITSRTRVIPRTFKAFWKVY